MNIEYSAELKSYSVYFPTPLDATFYIFERRIPGATLAPCPEEKIMPGLSK